MSKRDLVLEIERARLDAADPSTPPERLEELFDGWDFRRALRRELRAAIARNPNAPPSLLRQAFEQFPEALLENPVLPLLLLEDPDFMRKLPEFVSGAVLARADVPESLVVTFSQRSPALADEARHHVLLAGETGDEWVALVQAEFGKLMQRRLNPERHACVLALLEQGEVSPRVAERLLGEQLRRWERVSFCWGARRNSGYQPLFDLLRRLTGTWDLSGPVRPDVPAAPEELACLAAGGTWLRRLAARHPNTPPELLECLAADPEVAVRRAVARHPATPVEALETLAASPRLRERLAVARNESAPAELLCRLARDPEARVRAAVARHPAIPMGVAEDLACDPDTRVRNSAERALRPIATPEPACAGCGRLQPTEPLETIRLPLPEPPAEVSLKEWVAGLAIPVRLALARDRAQPPDLLMRLASDRERDIRLAVAGNPATPPLALERLATSRYDAIRLRVARNRNTPAKTLSGLARGWSAEITRAVLRNPVAPAELIEKYAAGAAWRVRSPEALVRLAEDPSVQVRRSLWRNRHLPVEAGEMLREKVLAACGGCHEPLPAILGLSHPALPEKHLRTASRSHRWQVRLGVTLHPTPPYDLLEKLARDGNRLVRAAARWRLTGNPPPECLWGVG